MSISSDSFYSDGSTAVGAQGLSSSTPKWRQKQFRRAPVRVQSEMFSPISSEWSYSEGSSSSTSSFDGADHRPHRRISNMRNERHSMVAPEYPFLTDECASDSPDFRCGICDKGFFHKSAVQAHELLHSSTLPRKAKAKKLDVLVPLENRLHHARNTAMTRRLREIPTQVAFQEFNLDLTRLDELPKPKNSHVCQVCGKCFGKKTSLRLHQTKRHIHTREFLLFL